MTWRRSSPQARKAAAPDAAAAVGTKGAIKQKRRNNFVSHMRYSDAYFFQTICNLSNIYCGVTIKQTIIDVQEWNVPSLTSNAPHMRTTPRLNLYARTTVSVYTA